MPGIFYQASAGDYEYFIDFPDGKTPRVASLYVGESHEEVFADGLRYAGCEVHDIGSIEDLLDPASDFSEALDSEVAACITPEVVSRRLALMPATEL